MLQPCPACGALIPPSELTPGLCPVCVLDRVLEAPDGEDADAPELIEGTIFGPYRIGALLGRGGMASVYEAHEPRLDRTVALKVLAPQLLREESFAQRFAHEARVAAALEHPNIVPIYATGIEDGLPWVSMRLLPGGTLGDRLRATRLAPAAALALLGGVARALDYAHARGVIHRDIKPSNILLDDADGVCVADFGVARLIDRDIALTRTGAIVGTPQYMAPEQALGGDVDFRGDLYSLGVVAYEMLEGAPPFGGRSPVAILLQHVHAPVPVPPRERVPRAAAVVLERALAKDPSQRWPSATAFVDALAKHVREPQRRRLRAWTPLVPRLAMTGAVLLGVLIMLQTMVAPGDGSNVAAARPLIGPPTEPAGAEGSTPSAETLRVAKPTPSDSSALPKAADSRSARARKQQERTVPPADPSSPAAADDPVEPQSVPTSTIAIGHAVGLGSNLTFQMPPPPPPQVAVVNEAVITKRSQPKYPPRAVIGGYGGVVELEAVCGIDGRLRDARIVKSAMRDLDDAARQNLEREWTCQPATRNGQVEPSIIRNIVVRFIK